MSVTPSGLCTGCGPTVTSDIEQRGKAILECVELVQQTRRPDVQLENCDRLIEHARALAEYERRGIPTIQPPGSEYLRRYEPARDGVAFRAFKHQLDEDLAKVHASADTTAKIRLLAQIESKVREHNAQATGPRVLDSLEREVVRLARQTQLDAYLEEARQTEQNGDRKKALEYYHHALDSLKRMDADELPHKGSIKAVQDKIAELSESS